MGISRFFVNFEILLLLLERKSKGSIFLCLIFFLCFQNFSAQEQGVIYVIGDAQIVGLNENVSVVVYNNDKDIQLSQITEVKKVANKRKTTKKTEINVLSDRKKISKEEIFGTIEAVKTVSDLFMPISAEVLEFNAELESAPELVNSDPYGKGWIVKISIDNIAELDSLLDSSAYTALVGA